MILYGEAMSANPSALECQPYFTRGDPLTHFLKGRLCLNPWLGMILLVTLINLPLLVIATVDNLWMDRDGLVGLAHDFGWWILQFASFPATIFYFLWASDGINQVLDGLEANHVVVMPTVAAGEITPYEQFKREFDKNYSRPAWIALSLILAILFAILIIPVHRAFKSWAALDEVAFWYTAFVWFLLAFAICLLILRGAIVMYWFNRLFRRFEIRVRPLHKDGAGGLAPLGNFSVKVGYLIAIYGFAAVVLALGQSYLTTGQLGGLVLNLPLTIILVLYLILSPLAFLAPIGTAHAAMQRARRNFLHRVADQLETDLAHLQNSFSASALELKNDLDKIEQLQRVHALALRFPVWPFNTANLVRFFSSTLSPVVLALAPTVGNLLARFIIR